jgi:hypothetical protein
LFENNRTGPKSWATYSQKMFCNEFHKEIVQMYFSRFFHKIIWSP